MNYVPLAHFTSTKLGLDPGVLRYLRLGDSRMYGLDDVREVP